MKLYVVNPNSKQKEYLNITGSTRRELANNIGNQWFVLNGVQYHVHHVIAESDSNSTVAGLVIGGLLGLIGGPFGVVIGGAIGGALGNDSDSGEQKQVEFFNQSFIER